MSNQVSGSVSVMGAVATSHGLATDAGAEILANGGNVFDAAVAASLATCVTESYYSQLGGTTIITYKTAGGPPQVVQARGKTPQRLQREVFLDGDRERPDRLDAGPLSVSIPSLLGGLYTLWQKHGRMEWDKLIAPAIRLASEGFCIDSFFSEYHRNEKVQAKLKKYGGPPFVLSEKPYLEKGDLWVQKDLADTLSRIAEEGADAFYRGSVGERIVDHLQAHGGVMAYSDLADYQPELVSPLSITYGDWTVTAPPSPAVGGPQILQALMILESFPVKEMGFGSSEYLHLLIETLKLTFMQRAELGPEGITADMLGKEYVTGLREKIHRDRALPFGSLSGDEPESRGTSHFCVVDSAGNVVSMTQTVRDLFGSGVVVPGTGVLLNNQVADFIIKPRGKRSGHSIREGTGNIVGPGLTPKSNKSPIVAYNEQTGAIIGIGAGGGPMIISGVLQVLINYMTFGMDLTNAQQAPRAHYHGDLVEVEGWFSQDVMSRLEDKGHEVRVFGDRARVRWAGDKVADEGPPVARRVMPCIVQCAARDAAGGLDVAADPRGPGNGLILGKHDSGLWAERYGYGMLGGAGRLPF
jgi:gamma-glutamyltranspeptidase/glutathione hydrolase